MLCEKFSDVLLVVGDVLLVLVVEEVMINVCNDELFIVFSECENVL